MPDVYFPYELCCCHQAVFDFVPSGIRLELWAGNTFLAFFGFGRRRRDRADRINEVGREVKEGSSASEGRQEGLYQRYHHEGIPSGQHQSARQLMLHTDELETAHSQIPNETPDQKPHFLASRLHHQLSHHVPLDLSALAPLDFAQAEHTFVHVPY